MPRAFWKGTISFGMVAIPVRMSIATKTETPSFHLLHNKCLTRPKQVLYCAQDEEYFSTRETVRGYEYSKDQYVVFDEGELEKVPVKTAHSIDIHAFVKLAEIDPIYFEGSHYLEPEPLGVKPFALLKSVLEKTGLAGIAKVTFQRREHLCCLRPLAEIMVLHSLRYRKDILPVGDLVPPKPAVSEPEMDMAIKLVEAMTTAFSPEKYRDEYTSALKKMVEAKLRGVEVKAPKTEKIEIEDLMAALKQSVAAAGRRK